MTLREFFEWLENEQQPRDITLPLPIRISAPNAMAARLLLWLFEEMPEDSTYGDLEDVLDAAKWWSMFWGSAAAAAIEATTNEAL